MKSVTMLLHVWESALLLSVSYTYEMLKIKTSTVASLLFETSGQCIVVLKDHQIIILWHGV